MIQEADRKLVEDAGILNEKIQESLEWIKENVPPAEGQMTSVNMLRNFRRRAKHLENAARRRPCVAIFGESQVGKSYLVSNLARLPGSNNLKIIVHGESDVDFIKEINPDGNKESTGLVTRFTIADNHEPGQAPFFLSLLSQIDIVKILANGYFLDVTQRQYEIDGVKLQSLISEMRQKAGSSSIDGLHEDDLYDLKDYLWENFSNEGAIQSLNNFGFWEDASRLLPRLKSEERWRLFHLLWGELPIITKIFNLLSDGLKKLGFPKEVRCGKEALIPKAIQLNGKTKPNSIIDVYVLENLLGNDDLEPIHLHDLNENTSLLPRSIVTALTSEITMILPKDTAENKGRNFFKDVDVLDFPGARSRYQIPFQNFKDSDAISIFLRGKISFLFDQYCYNNEISSLALCLQDLPSNVQTLPKLISNWVYKTHGKQANERDNKLASIFVVFTKFNIDMTGKTSDTIGEPSCHNSKWNARIDANFCEFIVRGMDQNWPKEWNSSGAFKNCFWLRDPQYSKHIFEGLDEFGNGVEKAVKKEFTQKLEDMKTSFLSHPSVKKHFHDIKRSWDEVTEPGKSGIDYFVEYLTPTLDPKIKRNQLIFQLNNLRKEVFLHLKQYYKSNDLQTELDKAREKGIAVAKELYQLLKTKNSFGFFLDKLHISDDFVWKVYYDIENPSFDYETEQSNSTNGPSVKIDDEEFGIMLGPEFANDADKSTEKPDSKYKEKSDCFAETLIDRWRSYLEELGSSKRYLSQIGIKKETYQLIIHELSKCLQRRPAEDKKDEMIARVDLVSLISNSVKEEIERNTDAKNIDLIARLANSELNKFINTLGWGMIADQQIPKIKLKDGTECNIFSEKPICTPDRSNVKLDIDFPGTLFVAQWLIGIQETFRANVEFIFGGGIPDEVANKMLGDLLDQIACNI